MKHILIAALIGTFALPAAANNLTQLQRGAQVALHNYGYHDVDVTELNTAQLAQIRHLAGSGKGHGDIRGSIGAVVRNGIVNFLRG
ncbi:MAG: hypothetical protein ABJN34_07215 [Litoreibacter sp.]|uniref:hypothetical protein n=1 Tax=Litoreibacter sp. TaxID=1969459 RepID=UPI003298E20D